MQPPGLGLRAFLHHLPHPRRCGRDGGSDRSLCPEGNLWARAPRLGSTILHAENSSFINKAWFWHHLRESPHTTPSPYVCGARSCGFRIKERVRPEPVAAFWLSVLIWVPEFPSEDLNTHICTWQPGKCVLNAN